MKIVRANTHHIARMAELEKLCFSMPWSRIMLLSELTNPIGYYVACEENAELVGYAGMQIVIDEGYITNVAVDPAYRGRGIGSMLLSALLGRAGERDLAFLTLEVRESNLTAQGLYDKFGFEVVGKRKGYYEKPTEDALLMTRELIKDNGK